MKELIEDLKKSSQKRSNFLQHLNYMVKEREKRMRTEMQEKGYTCDFIEKNKAVSPENSARNHKQEYFNLMN